MMKKLAIFATAAALMLGLPSVANATTCTAPADVNLVLEDGTDVGEVDFTCNGVLEVTSTPSREISSFSKALWTSLPPTTALARLTAPLPISTRQATQGSARVTSARH